jgi:hypothetical protein
VYIWYFNQFNSLYCFFLYCPAPIIQQLAVHSAMPSLHRCNVFLYHFLFLSPPPSPADRPTIIITCSCYMYVCVYIYVYETIYVFMYLLGLASIYEGKRATSVLKSCFKVIFQIKN